MTKVQLQVKSKKIYIVEISDLHKAKVLTEMFQTCGYGADPKVEMESEIIPLPNLTEPCMDKLLDYCRHYKNDSNKDLPDEDRMFDFEINDWDRQFLESTHDGILFELLIASRYLEIFTLKHLITTYVAMTIADSEDQTAVKKRFGFKDNMLPKDIISIGKRVAAERAGRKEAEVNPLTGNGATGGSTPASPTV